MDEGTYLDKRFRKDWVHKKSNNLKNNRTMKNNDLEKFVGVIILLTIVAVGIVLILKSFGEQ
jgi:hypothetical protein